MFDLPKIWCPHCCRYHEVRTLVDVDPCPYTNQRMVIDAIDRKTWRVRDDYSDSITSSTLSGSVLPSRAGSGVYGTIIVSSGDRIPTCRKCGKTLLSFGQHYCDGCGFDLD